MSFLAPGFLIAAVAAAVGMVALHFIVTRRPRAVAFPTARFVPDVPAVARSRSVKLSDLLLLVVRILTVLLAGAALARPVVAPEREKTVRVMAADVSGSVASPAEVRDSVAALFRPGDAIVEFDTAARLVSAPDSLGLQRRVAVPGSLSAGLVAALRAAARVRQGADSVELVVVSAASAGERDRATDSIRSQWAGRARLVRVAPSSPAYSGRPVQPPNSRLRFLPPDSRPRYAVARTLIDTVGAVVAGDDVVVARFERRWRFTGDSLAHARVMARWVDGDPAVIEKDSSTGCIEATAISPDSAGDLLLRPEFVRFNAALTAPCAPTAAHFDIATAAMLAGSGSLASAGQFSAPVDVDSPIARWLAIVALVLAIAEMVIRHNGAAEREQ